VTKAQEDFRFPLAGPPALLRVDPDLTVLAKVNFPTPGDMMQAQLKSDIIGRMLAVEQLGKKKDDATVKQLTEIASGDPHYAIRVEAVEALQQMSNDAARTALAGLTTQPDERVRKAVADALGGIFHPDAHAALVKMVAAEQNPLIVSSIINSFAAWPQEDLVPFLKRPSYHNMIAAAAIRTLSRQNRQDAVPAIIAAVKAGGFPARELGTALTAIGSLARGSKDETIEPFLRGYLSFPHRVVRIAAANALGDLGDLRAVPVLNAVASQKSNPAATAAADAAGRIQALQTNPAAQSIEAWKKVDALLRKTEELEKKIEVLEKKKPA
jgi:aminopeptidase N